MKKFLFLLFLVIAMHASLNAEKKCHINFDKIVERIFKLDVSPYNNAFNPSICPLGDEYLLSFRYLAEPNTRPWISYVGVMRLDKSFNRISDPVLLDLRKDNIWIPSQAEDARLFVYDDEIYIIYNDNPLVECPSQDQYREMFMAQVFYENGCFSVGEPTKITHKENYYTHKWEKNWTPFVFEDSLMMYYSFGPNQILDVNWESEECSPLFTTSSALKWSWGALRGGTPALMVDGEYLAFFHSSINTFSNVSEDQPRYHYFMGAYTFSATPPFKMKKISREPINGKNLYTKSHMPKRVIYPGGYVIADGNIYVAYGKDDCEVWMAVMNKNKLMKSLNPIEKRKTRHGRNVF